MWKWWYSLSVMSFKSVYYIWVATTFCSTNTTLPHSGQTFVLHVNSTWTEETAHHVVWGGDELHSGVLDLWSLMGLTIRSGDWVVHELIWNWTRKVKKSVFDKMIRQWHNYRTEHFLDWTHTIIDPVTQVAFPPALVQEGDKRVDVGATGATAHDRVWCDHW